MQIIAPITFVIMSESLSEWWWVKEWISMIPGTLTGYVSVAAPQRQRIEAQDLRLHQSTGP